MIVCLLFLFSYSVGEEKKVRVARPNLSTEQQRLEVAYARTTSRRERDEVVGFVS